MAAIFLFFHSELCGFLQMYAHIFVVVNSRNFTQFMKKNSNTRQVFIRRQGKIIAYEVCILDILIRNEKKNKQTNT